ncbi:hypothetical protein DPMN_148886 [Dreissena polymorpha]|uniref:Uncharacterized protein n=1 Tax=Dreissena polymorpha TaxID=45954 RepID=A0A9D4J0N0_DREPO|nr:hypothetical protein DPMN_148886 [Dreissena polymorpha]
MSRDYVWIPMSLDLCMETYASGLCMDTYVSELCMETYASRLCMETYVSELVEMNPCLCDLIP